MSDDHWPPPHDPATCPDCVRARTPRRLQSDPATYVEGREAPMREGCCDDGERVIRDYEGRRVIVTGLLGPDRVPAMLRAEADLPARCSITTVFFCPWCGASLAAAKEAGR